MTFSFDHIIKPTGDVQYHPGEQQVDAASSLLRSLRALGRVGNNPAVDAGQTATVGGTSPPPVVQMLPMWATDP